MGIDLAAEPKGTAAALLRWHDDSVTVEQVVEQADDDTLTALGRDADMIGIDCPLGWPDPFVAFVADHAAGRAPQLDTAAPRWREPLVKRATDLACETYTRQRLGRPVRPLSVSADLLGHVAMRAAVLLDRFGRVGIGVDRSGLTGRVAEVYPAASLALWQVTVAPDGTRARSYKGVAGRAVLGGLLTATERDLGGVTWCDGGRAACENSDHPFDAVVAALAARAAALGAVTRPGDEDERRRAGREGWIALPTGPLAALREDASAG